MRCEHEYDDSAYVLGALSPAERSTYERHLSTCSFCRGAVTDLAVLPGLLRRIDPADLERLLEPPVGHPVPGQPDRTPELVLAAQTRRRRERSRTRWRTAAIALVAACLALVAGAGAVTWLNRPSPVTETTPQTVAMQPVARPASVSANASLTTTLWGTRIDMVCNFAENEKTPAKGESPEPYTFRLMAYGPDNVSEQVGSWIAGPGAEVRVSGMTRLTGKNLARLDLIRNDGARVLAYSAP